MPSLVWFMNLMSVMLLLGSGVFVLYVLYLAMKALLLYIKKNSSD
jgi:hypothetical protein